MSKRRNRGVSPRDKRRPGVGAKSTRQRRPRAPNLEITLPLRQHKIPMPWKGLPLPPTKSVVGRPIRRIGRTNTPIKRIALTTFRPEVSTRKNSYCKIRKQRRAVIFARGVGGRRRSAPGPYHRKPSSNTRCT